MRRAHFRTVSVTGDLQNITKPLTEENLQIFLLPFLTEREVNLWIFV